jgi:hypoxanthine-guanine phosphoribosyltransferase
MNTWQRTKQLYDSLEYDTGENFAIIGIMSGQVNDEGDELPMIAAIHEFGALSVGIYERPLFRPTMEEMMSWLESQDIGKEVLEQLQGL